ncbi:hypothetical protein C4D60_Mb07t21830 [Musa balbisiana]|uniref:DUF676 domain-containing protein n=1 Tax=Musa balbisiana TaxID=52838 RepID=A0A4S8JIC0_MUSBA|nr:hypothetical protein C4D60_Mb07t21830 [Musa balbisiana]
MVREMNGGVGDVGGEDWTEEESVNGGNDVWSSSRPADHLVVMVHGILGSTADWKFAAQQFVAMLPDKVIVHCSESNMYKLTLDGVDIMGERLAEEIIEVVNKRLYLRKISFIAHSVGGLVARYAIGRLYRPLVMKSLENPLCDACDDSHRGTIYGLEAVNFITVATPHLGSRGNKQWEDSLSEKYPHVVYEEYSAGSRNDKCTDDSLINGDCDLLEEKLVTGLARLSWEKVDVSFHNSSIHRFAAHSVIQVKDPFMHIEGADVIQHMIDHFLT